jgi:hypothetical protein
VLVAAAAAAAGGELSSALVCSEASKSRMAALKRVGLGP